MTLIIELPESKEAALQAKARAQGMSAEQYAAQVIDRDLKEGQGGPAALSSRHISEIIRERMSKVPAEVWATFPADGASEHDHYIYGTPKKNQSKQFSLIRTIGSR